MDPGVGMREPAGGLGSGHAGGRPSRTASGAAPARVSICLSDFSEVSAIPTAWPFADFTERSPLRFQRVA